MQSENQTEQVRIALPRYRSHKVVEAAKIVDVQVVEQQGAQLMVEMQGPDGQPGRGGVFVDAAYVAKHKPVAGAYYVRYADGYESLSPAEAFESGYVPEPNVLQVAPPVRRTLNCHQVNAANEQLVIEALDNRLPDGAHHLYRIRGFDSTSNPSCPFQALYGAPALHSTVLFQNGPIKEAGVNGVTHEALLAIIEDRLVCFQEGQFACDENKVALDHIRAAQRFLQARTRRRIAQGVEGTHQGS